jgi:hypothetical protein
MSLLTFKSITRTAIVALAIGGVALAALPAQAAPTLGGALQLEAPIKPQVQLQPDAGNGTQMQMKKFGGDDYDDYDYDDYDWCLTNKQIRKGLKYADFDDIDFVKELKHHRVRVEALYEGDGWVYSMRIDRCDGEVDQIKPLYEAGDFEIDF